MTSICLLTHTEAADGGPSGVPVCCCVNFLNIIFMVRICGADELAPGSEVEPS